MYSLFSLLCNLFGVSVISEVLLYKYKPHGSENHTATYSTYKQERPV